MATKKRITNLQIDGLRAGASLSFGEGLYLDANQHGEKRWFVRWQNPDSGKRGRVWIGTYPEMTQGVAVDRAGQIRQAARTGEEIIGVIQEARLRKEAQHAEQKRIEQAQADALKYSFRNVSEQWLEFKRQSWSADTHKRAEDAVRDYLQPRIGNLDMRHAKTKPVREALLEINATVPSTARKCRQYVSGVLKYCMMHEIRDDGSLMDLSGIFPTNRAARHHHAITDVAGIGKLWLAIQQYSGSHAVKSALQFCAWTAMRPGVVASAQWSEIDMDAALWTLHADRMKMKNDHVSGLPRQAIAMLEVVKQYSTGEYVFSAHGPGGSPQGRKHIHRDALSKALREMGFRGQHVTHGWRASFRTLCRERLNIDVDYLEAQLAHVRGDSTQVAYDRAKFLEQRVLVVQTWADWLDQQAAIAAGDNITRIREVV